jgi:hypothetical protein
LRWSWQYVKMQTHAHDDTMHTAQLTVALAAVEDAVAKLFLPYPTLNAATAPFE